MTYAKHTPGPWAVEKNGGNHWGMLKVIGPAISVTGFTIATDVSAERAALIAADAELISRAPQMASALDTAERALYAIFDRIPHDMPLSILGSREVRRWAETALKSVRNALAIDEEGAAIREEERREEAQANSQFGVGS